MTESIEGLRLFVKHGTVAKHGHPLVHKHHIAAQTLCALHFVFVEAQIVGVFQNDALLRFRFCMLSRLRQFVNFGHGECRAKHRQQEKV